MNLGRNNRAWDIFSIKLQWFSVFQCERQTSFVWLETCVLINKLTSPFINCSLGAPEVSWLIKQASFIYITLNAKWLFNLYMHTKKHGKYLSRACHSTMLRCTAAILDPVRVIWPYHDAESSHTVVSWFTKARMKVRAVRSLSLRGKKNIKNPGNCILKTTRYQHVVRTAAEVKHLLRKWDRC